jgi:hypothetical protein
MYTQDTTGVNWNGRSGTSGWSENWFCPNCGNKEGIIIPETNPAKFVCNSCKWEGEYVLDSEEEFLNFQRHKKLIEILQ